jgi:hypothetical protein
LKVETYQKTRWDEKDTPFNEESEIKRLKENAK